MRRFIPSIEITFVVLAFCIIAAVYFQALQTVQGEESPVDAVVAMLKQEEGFRSKPYRDSRGVLTIGYGTNISEGITHEEAGFLLRERLERTQESLANALPWFSSQPVQTREALLDMAYQIGVNGVLEFSMMLTYLHQGNCQAAQTAALDSDWARETPVRAERVTGRIC